MSVQIPWAPDAEYTKVLCRIGEPRPDGADVDRYPDLHSQGGTVTLTCNAKVIRYMEDDDRYRILTMRPWTFDIDKTTGELVSQSDGLVGVYIISGSSELVDPQGFTWTALVKPEYGSSFEVVIPPDAGETFDLAEWMTLTTPSSGEPVTRGPRGYAGTVGVGDVTSTNGQPEVINVGTPQAAILDFKLQRGEQGDPFTYEDFTQPQLDALTGPQGEQGEQGEPGINGDGVPDGGVTDQVLVKNSNQDQDVKWVHPQELAGLGAFVDGKLGPVEAVLDAILEGTP